MLNKTLLLLTGLCILAACNTVQGIGKDVKKLGQKIEKSSDE